MRLLPLLLIAALAASGASAKPAPFAWPQGKHAAVVLTYDDALHSQLDVAVPQLDAAHLKGTFFLKIEGMTSQDVVRWRSAASNGHELGNHTIYHPCPRAMLPGRDRYATETYDPQSMVSEIAVTNTVLFAIDGRPDHTLSYPCSQTLAGGSDYTETLKHSGQIRYARTGGDPFNSVVTDFDTLNLMQVPSNGPVNHPDGAELIAYVKRVHDAGGLGVLQFHGVGGDYLDVSATAHQQLVDYLREHPDVWVATFQEVMGYVAAHRSGQ